MLTQEAAQQNLEEHRKASQGNPEEDGNLEAGLLACLEDHQREEAHPLRKIR